ncbi:MAG TPA: ATP synthase F1 subunit delta [Flavobacteriia bacterium]|jgi:F-type H+-transporting ATPase subunit delta|nr:ATP synthase F1 subunit delta [Flavobacteriia bacterium]
MNRAALRYAKAALSLAKQQNKQEKINQDMQLIDQTISDSKELQSFLNDPTFKAEEKLKTINAVFGDKIDAVTKGIIKLLIQNKRLNLLPFVAKQYQNLYKKSQNVASAVVTSAVPLTNTLKDKILQKIKKETNKDVSLENVIDDTIIGGFVLQIGDKQIDASVSGKLNNLSRKFQKTEK